MALETITKKVVSYCEIPEDVIPDGHWIEEHHCDAFVECHLDGEPGDELDEWLMTTYPELVDEESFFIHLDY